MFNIGEVFADKYKIVGLAPDVGGMGRVLFVKAFGSDEKMALKICKEPIYYDRFKREVKIMKKYKGNTKVVQIIDYDLDYDPPFFVMPFAQGGDLQSKIDKISKNPALQEQVFFYMIDSVAELHAASDIHRDIKPQNFLIMMDGSIVVSDLGLAKDAETGTSFTRTYDRGGTQEYAPPEFFEPGGFKNAAIGWDIFSLGKSFYRILTGRHAQHLSAQGIAPSVYYVIQRCTEIELRNRFKNLSELRQAVKDAYDITLGRMDARSEFDNLLNLICNKISHRNEYASDELDRLFVVLRGLDEIAQLELIESVPRSLLSIICEDSTLVQHLDLFIDIYGKMLTSKLMRPIPFSYAEEVADDMEVIFFSSLPKNESKAHALEKAILMAIACNRFAAMSTCKNMIVSVSDEGLGMLVGEIIVKYGDQDFIKRIEPTTCNSAAVNRKITAIRSNSSINLL